MDSLSACMEENNSDKGPKANLAYKKIRKIVA